jgi:uncharacterized protein (DUF1697 family)
VALFRGINVGRAKRVAMADLRSLFSDLGYHHVQTLLNSGNVVFAESPGGPKDAAARIEQALIDRLQVAARVWVFTAAQLTDAIRANPLTSIADNPSRLVVTFLADKKVARRLTPLLDQAWTPEAVAQGPRVAYLWCPGGIGVSPLMEAVGKALGDNFTARNWSTVTKLHALATAPDGGSSRSPRRRP